MYRLQGLLVCCLLFSKVSSALAACGAGQALTVPESSEVAKGVLRLNAQLTPAAMSGSGGMTVARRGLLRARHDLVLRLLREHPEEARAVLLSSESAATLRNAGDEAAALLEQEETLTGQLQATVADDFVHGTSATHWHLHGRTLDTDLFGEVDARMARQQVEAHGIVLDGVMAIESTSAPTLRLDGELKLMSATTAIAGATVAGLPPAVCSTMGDQKVAVLVLRFPGGPDYGVAAASVPGVFSNYLFSAASPSVNSFWAEASYRQASASGDVYGPITLPATYDCTTTTQMRSAALAAAAGLVDFSRYSHIMLVFPTASCSFGGLGDVGCRTADATFPTENSTVWVPVAQNGTSSSIGVAGVAGVPNTYLVETASHELGHNLGMNHANTLDFGRLSLGPIDFDATNPGTVGGTGVSMATTRITAVNTEYADNFDAMAVPYAAAGPYNSQHRAESLGWIGSSDTETLLSQGKTVTLQAVENASGTRAVRVLRDPRTASFLWLEFHQASEPYSAANLVSLTGNNATAGVQVHYEDGFNQSGTGTRLLDMTPNPAGNTPNDFRDGALLAGSTWSDPFSPITLRTNSVGAAGASVTVSYDAPCATVSLSSDTVAAVGGSGYINVTAPPACAWHAFVNAPWVSLTGADASGTVSGAGSGSVTYTAVAGTGVQRTTYVSLGRQSLPLTQMAANTTLVSLSPSEVEVMPGQPQVLQLVIDDPAGVSDLRQVNLFIQPAFGQTGCPVYVIFNGGTPYFSLSTAAGAVSVMAGSSDSTSTGVCSISGRTSSLSWSGSRFTLNFGMSFAAGFTGVHAVQAFAASTMQSTPVISLGTLLVDGPPSIVMVPAMAARGVTTPAGITGTRTHFGPASTVTISGLGVTAGTPTVSSGTTLTVDLTVAPGAPAMAHILTVTTGTESVSTTFVIPSVKNTTTNLTLSSLSVTPATKPTLTATVIGMGSTVPSGTVAFLDGDTPLGSAALSSGNAIFVAGAFTAGLHPLTAVYSGDAANSGSTSPVRTLTSAPANTTTVLSASAVSVLPSAHTTLTATVVTTPGNGGPAAAGTVSFLDGSTLLGVATLSAGTATLVSGPYAAGVHSITAVYSGDTSNASSTSALMDLVVSKATSSVTLQAASAQLFAGSALTLNAKASVTPAGGGAMAGSVTFLDGVIEIGKVALGQSGGATMTVASLPAGTHTFTATYSGSGDVAGSNSSPLPVVVSDFTLSTANAALTVTAGADSGNAVAFTVTPGNGGFPAAVVFSCDGLPPTANCAFSPADVIPNGAAASTTLTVRTTARPAMLARSSVAVLILPAMALWRRRRFRRAVLSAPFLASLGAYLALSLTGCGSGGAIDPASVSSSNGTAAGGYTVRVTATAANGAATLTRTAVVALTVR